MENKWNDKVALAKVRQRILDKLETAGKFVEDSAKLLVPVDMGYLKGSIHHSVSDLELSVIIIVLADYAPYIEFGTGEKAESGQGRKGGWFYVSDRKQAKGFLVGETKDGKFLYFTYGNKPQKFLRPALFENKGTIKKIMEL